MNKEDELVSVRILRYDPSIDREPRYEMYRVPTVGRTVLNVLTYIYENYDTSLSFRSGCMGKGAGRCLACAVLVNGTPALSCQKMAQEDMVVEPHPKFELIKDLVVNLSRVKSQRLERQTAVKITIDNEKCVGCRDCILICPVSVYTLQKVSGKNKAIPSDIGSCCGVTCKMCVSHCSHGAIVMWPLE